jgi:hypothetical protein
MDSDEQRYLDIMRKQRKAITDIKEDIQTRRKVLNTKLSSQGKKKTEYYLKEKTRDRTKTETDVQSLQNELEARLDKLKREYEAEVQSITKKIELKISILKEKTDLYQRYCDERLDADNDEDSDLVLVKYKEQLKIAEENYEKTRGLWDTLCQKNEKYRLEENKLRARELQWKLEEEQRREEEKQRKASQEREALIQAEVEKNKEEKRKAREEQETQEVKPVKKLLVNVDRSEERHICEGRIRQYHNSLCKKEKIIFNLLTYKEKLEIITSQDLDKKVKQYEDNLIINHKGDGVNRELSTFRDMEERSRYIKALGQEVMDKQYDIIKKYSDKYTKEESESDSDSVSSKSSKESIKQKKPKVAEVMHFSDNFGNNPKLLLSTKRK